MIRKYFFSSYAVTSIFGSDKEFDVLGACFCQVIKDAFNSESKLIIYIHRTDLLRVVVKAAVRELRDVWIVLAGKLCQLDAAIG